MLNEKITLIYCWGKKPTVIILFVKIAYLLTKFSFLKLQKQNLIIIDCFYYDYWLKSLNFTKIFVIIICAIE
jgi:hypothetical protein